MSSGSRTALPVWLPILPGLLLPPLAAPPAAAQTDPPAARVAAAADSLLADLHARGLFNGAVVLGRDEELYAGGFGPADRAAGVALTPDTPVDAGSIAKTFTAATVLMLVREGRLQLDAPVRDYVDEYPHGGTTLRHLMMHSTGLPRPSTTSSTS